MRNPWLEIPLDDYEAHMALPTVGQARMLADALEAPDGKQFAVEIFRRVIADESPSIARRTRRVLK